jgi:hypothetical protein
MGTKQVSVVPTWTVQLDLHSTTNFITGRLHPIAVPVMRVCHSHAPHGPCYLPRCNEQLQPRRADILLRSIVVPLLDVTWPVLCLSSAMSSYI